MDAFDVIVIGGGPAGMAAACAADMRSLRVLLIERAAKLGGILNQCAHSGFGFAYFGEELIGREFAKRLVEKVDASSVEVLTDAIVLEIRADRSIAVSGEALGLRRIQASAIVLATGCRERPIGSLNIAGTRPSGVFPAGAAQKMLNLGGYDIGSKFVVLGSGDVGLIVARELVLRGKDVLAVVEKEAVCGGLERNRLNCLVRFGIPLLTLSTISKVHGTERVCGVTISDSFGNERFVECDCLITSVGLIPERELLDGLSKSRREAKVFSDVEKEERLSGLPPWLFVCGNAAFVYDVVDGAVFDAERAGRAAADFVLAGA